MSGGVFEDLKVHLEDALERHAPKTERDREGLRAAIDEALAVAEDRISYMATIANTQLRADEQKITEADHEAIRATLETERESPQPSSARGGEGQEARSRD